jgi:multicomponent Na+:H+ antiporter subunit A
MIVTLAALAVIGLVLVVGGARLRRGAFLVAAVPVLGAAIWIAAQLGEVTSGVSLTQQARWAPQLGLSIDLRLDGLAATMSLGIAAVGVTVLVYSVRYFASDADDLGRLAGLLVLFCASMLGLVQADHVVFLYCCWELTSITSFLLIGNRHTEARARAAALHALLVTSAGGLALLAGLLLMAQEAGTYRLSEILQDPPPASSVMTAAMILLVVGAFTKSAQYPFHAWLPGAMAAPTPVSAYLHSATMVTAGVYLVARFAPMFVSTELWRPVVVAVGCATFVFGGLRALRQHDLKLLLAFGTVSQLGLMVVLFGLGTRAAAIAAWELLVAHTAFKAALFMVVGIVDHQTGTRDIRVVPPLVEGWRGVRIVTLLAAASMAGVPLAAGFVAKELAYEALADAPVGGADLLLALVVAGSMLTAAYAVRFYWGAFVAPRRQWHDRSGPYTAPPSTVLVAPAAVLALVGVVLGVAPWVADPLATASVAAFGAAPEVHLTVWHGFGVPVVLSALALVGGVAIALGDRWVQPWLARGGAIPSGAEVYLAALRGLGVVSTRVTGFVQNGSLPVYAGVILGTAAVLSAGALLATWDWAGWPPLGDLGEAPVAMVLLMAALGAAVVRRRFAAALFLGAAGYAMAGLFVLSGAPDLALTQVTVETLATVVFVLVLRRLPERFERQSTPRRRVVRLLIAAAVGSMVFVFALIAAGYRLTPPVSQEMVARAVPDGHGRNVVNVILVDFRGFDTLGEITVLAVASIGAVALGRVGRRAAELRGEPEPVNRDVRRLAFVDVSVRIVFYAVLMMSLWLLFAGHNQPGGGFVGGLLAGSAITLRFIAGGIEEVRGRSPFRPWTVLGVGLLLATTTASLPLLTGGSVLEVGYATLDVPAIGEVSLSSALAFDTGVYLAVVGMVLMAFEAFGSDPVEVPR